MAAHYPETDRDRIRRHDLAPASAAAPLRDPAREARHLERREVLRLLGLTELLDDDPSDARLLAMRDAIEAAAAVPPPGATVRAKVEAALRFAVPDVRSDVALLRSALLSLRPDPGETLPRWSLVRSALGHGSTVGTAICSAVGLDPDEEVSNPLSDLPEWIRDAIGVDPDEGGAR